MITITRQNPNEFAKDQVKKMKTTERLDIDILNDSRRETIDFVGLNAGRSEVLPLESIWEREEARPIKSYYTEGSNKECDKYRALRQLDRVLIHTSPEDNYSLERRATYPGETLSFRRDDQMGKNSLTNRLNGVSDDRQYQLIVAPKGNVMIRVVKQFNKNTNPEVIEMAYLNASCSNSCPDSNFVQEMREGFLTEALKRLPGFPDVNLLTDTIHGKEIRIVAPYCALGMVYSALKNAGYSKPERPESE